MTTLNLLRFSRRVFHFLKNQTYDLIYLGIPLGITVKTRHSYLGSYDAGYSDYFVLKNIFNHLEIQANDVLVDVGCARGRVIGWWLNNGLNNKIFGIELDKVLSKKAAKLFRKYDNVKIINGDILQNIPEDATIFYLFNPFKREVTQKFKQKIIETFVNKSITIIYCNCEFIDEFYSDRLWNIEMIHFPKSLTDHKAAIIKLNSSKVKSNRQKSLEDYVPTY
jgi:hypothetical protein